MKTLTLICFLLVSIISPGQQSSWQWGNRIGSSKIVGTGPEEQPKDICTDSYGNVYILNLVYPTGLLSVDTLIFGDYQTSAQNILLTSFRCDGTYRWTKIIGGAAGSYCNSVQADTLGGIYLFSNLYIYAGTIGHIDTDSSIAGTEQSMHVIKYDTSGTLQWIRSPQSDTISFENAINNSKAIDMHVSKNGIVSLLTRMPPGAHINSSLVLSQPGTYILQYDRFGNYLSALPLNFEIRGIGTSYQLSTNMTRSPNGNIIISGYRYQTAYETLVIENDTIDAIAFVVSFDSAGTLLWHHEILKYDSLYTNGLFLGRASTDADNSVYLSGIASHLDTIAGYTVNNPLSPNITATPILVKLYADGTLAWAKNAEVGSSTVGWGVATTNSTVAISGYYSGVMHWQGANTSTNNIPNQGYNPYIAIFNSQTGAFIMQDTLTSSNGNDEKAIGITVDKNGSYYVCGTFETNIILPNGTFQAWGDGDIFFAKYGTDDCEFTISVDELNSKDNFNFILFPNPGNGAFSVQFSNEIKNAKLKITDITGKLVYIEKIADVYSGQIKFFDIEAARGVYFIQIENGSFVETKKLMIY